MLFLQVQYLYFLLLIPIFLFLFCYFFFFRKRMLSKAFQAKLLNQLKPIASDRRKVTGFLCSLIALIFLILSVSRPVISYKEMNEKTEGVEIILAIDVSRSMLAQDVKPNRLSLVKTQLSQFLKMHKRNHRVGLLIFAGSSFLLSPLTSDLNLIQTYLSSLSPDMITGQGTNFTAALKEAEKSFKNGSVTQATKVLIIASDGENHETGALDVARRLTKQQGVRIFSLGVGTKKGGVIQTPQGYQRNQNGEVVQTAFKEQALKEFAKIGKGVFYHIGIQSNFANPLNQDLQKLNQAEFRAEKKAGYIELFQYFLSFSLLFYLLHWLMNRKIFN